MEAQFNLDDKLFQQSLKKVSLASHRSAYDVITFNSRDFLRALKFNTPKSTGNGRAGWWPAWIALDMPGNPSRRKTGTSIIRFKGQKNEYTAEGRVDDKRSQALDPYFEFSNESTVTDKKTGKQIRYLWVVNSKKNFMGKAKQEAAFKFDKSFDRLMKKYSAI